MSPEPARIPLIAIDKIGREERMPTDTVVAELQRRLDPDDRALVGVGDGYLKHIPSIRCADGFSMSVQASAGHYCSPRDSRGPWVAAEIGYPSERVEAFMPFIDGGPDTDPLATVYGYVPLTIIAEAIIAHGGFAK